MGIEESKQVFYIDGMKYQLTQDFTAYTGIKFAPEGSIMKMKYIKLFPDGRLLIKAGFAWDGSSGPTRDTKNTIPGSLIHDALYMLIRNGKIPQHYREWVDVLMRDRCLRDGMWRYRAWTWFKALRRWASFAASKESIRKVRVAP